MFELSLVLLALAAIMAMSRWRNGLYLVVLTALVQDPLRKLVPGQPAIFNTFVGIVFAASLIGAATSRVPLTPGNIVGWRRYAQRPFNLYVAIVFAQAVNSFLRFGNPLVPALGLVSYLAPFAALGVTYGFAASGGADRIRSFFLFYLICSGAALVSVYLQAEGMDLSAFGEVGVGIRIYDFGTVLTANSGTFRASEIAAWHAATCACVAIFVMTQKGLMGPRFIVAALLVVAFSWIGTLTGRRKSLVMVAIFFCAYMGLISVLVRRTRGPAIALALIGTVAYLAGVFTPDPDAVASIGRSGAYSLHLARSQTVFADIPTRFNDLGLAPVMWAYEWFGFFGGGLGIGTQGVQLLTEVGAHIGAAEGGLGKLTLELGVPGLISTLALMIAFVRHISRLLSDVSKRSPSLTRLACGLVALLIANAASFSVATQTFGDIFVLLFLGVTLGALLAIPTMEARIGVVAVAPLRRLGVKRPSQILGQQSSV